MQSEWNLWPHGSSFVTFFGVISSKQMQHSSYDDGDVEKSEENKLMK